MAPAFIASTAVSTLPNAVIITHRHLRVLAADQRQKLEAVHVGQLEIGQHQVGAVDDLEPLFGGGRFIDIEARGQQLQLDDAAQFFFVFDDQNAFFHAGAVHGQQHAEDAAFSGLALHCYLTAVFVHDLRNDREPEPDALRLGREERVEDRLQVLGLDPDAAVDHGDLGDARRRRASSPSPRRPAGVACAAFSTRL